MLRALFRQREPVAEQRTIGQATTWGIWPGDTGKTWSGSTVDRNHALQLVTVYGCVRLIADSIATLPIDVYRELADGTRVEITKPEWLTQPCVDLDYTSWVTQVLCSLLLDGNAYVAVTENDTRRVVELLPLDPQRINVARDFRGVKVVQYNGVEYTGRLLHIKGAMLPGAVVGMSPLEYARQTIGLGLATLEHGARFFGQGVMPGGMIEHPAKLSPEWKRDVAQQFQRKHSSNRNAHIPGVLDEGAHWVPPSITNEQAQFLETRGLTASEIAGQVFLVDPSDLGIPINGRSLTYANLLERTTRRVQVTLLPWIVRIEQALSSLLARPQFVKMNVDALLRGSADQRWANYQIASTINVAAKSIGMDPVLTTAEMRELEDFGPFSASETLPPSPPDPSPDPTQEDPNA